MTKTELKKIDNATYSYLVRYLYSKTDFNRDFLKLVKELGLFEELLKDFILSLSKEAKNNWQNSCQRGKMSGINLKNKHKKRGRYARNYR